MELQTVAAITAEYNPFHKGHAHQINVIRKTLGNVPIIAVMSGSVTQRGELALWDKWERARLACGAGSTSFWNFPPQASCAQLIILPPEPFRSCATQASSPIFLLAWKIRIEQN